MNVHERLTEAVRLIREREKWLHRLETTRNQIQEQTKVIGQLEKQLALESKDVERLDGITLLNLWHSLRGTKELAKRKEQEEYLAAKLKYDAADQALMALEEDLATIESNLAAMGDLDTKYQQALQDKEEYLLHSGSQEAQRLFDIAEQSGRLNAEKKELIEGIAAGNKAENAFLKVQKSLSSAQGWGAVDVLGGGLLSTAIKHSHIGDAKKEIDQAQVLLANFQRELADVKPTNDTMEIGKLEVFADFLLDGLLFDLIVQSKINTAQERTRQLQQKLQAAIQDLYRMQEQNRQKSLELDQQRRQIIESAD